MDLLEVHARLCLLQEAAGPVPEGEEFGPLVGTALADVSGRLDDAVDDGDLRDAVAHGTSLVSSGILTEADLHQSMSRVLLDLDRLTAEKGGPPCLNPSSN